MTAAPAVRPSEIPLAPPDGTMWHLDKLYSHSLGYLALYPAGTEFDGPIALKAGKGKKKHRDFEWSIVGMFVDRPRAMRRTSKKVIRLYWAKRRHEAAVARAASILDAS